MSSANFLKNFDCELFVYRHPMGVHLVPAYPQKNDRSFSTSLTVKDLLNLKLSSYFLDFESKILAANEACLEVLQLDSLKQGIGKNAFDITHDKSCFKILENDKHVIHNKQLCFFDESITNSDAIVFQALTIKIPCYFEKKVIGLFGLSILCGLHSVAESLQAVQATGLLDKQVFSNFLTNSCIDNVTFTRRELLIIKYITRGHSARAIGNHLNISRRTVEKHTENIKGKLGARTKAEVVEKIMARNT